jgi:glycosyltransferase involved in cell wall biosynthesis
MRVQVVTHLWPTEADPQYGVFVRDQVEALRRRSDVEVEVRSFPRGTRQYLRAAWALRRSVNRSEVDIVHAHYGLSGWSALATRARRLIVTFHGTDLRHRIVGPLSRLLIRLIRLPAAVSRSLAKSRVPGAGTRRSVAVLPCGVELKRFGRLTRPEARSRLGLEATRTYVLFPSDPRRRVKRYDRARELCNRRPAVELLTLDAVPPTDVTLWINAANAVLVTSDEEGFGLAVLEALACDVPVLATPVGIAPIALYGLAGTLCEPFEERRWLAVLDAHLADADPRVDGRSRAALFSSDRMADRLVAAYAELISS